MILLLTLIIPLFFPCLFIYPLTACYISNFYYPRLIDFLFRSTTVLIYFSAFHFSLLPFLTCPRCSSRQSILYIFIHFSYITSYVVFIISIKSFPYINSSLTLISPTFLIYAQLSIIIYAMPYVNQLDYCFS